MVILIIAGLVTFALVYTKTVDANQFLQENDMYINMLKEKDWDFYVAAKYGDRVNADELFNKRIKNTFWAVAIVMLVLFTNFTFINFVFMIVVAYVIYKSEYTNLRSYYKKYIQKI